MNQLHRKHPLVPRSTASGEKTSSPYRVPIRTTNQIIPRDTKLEIKKVLPTRDWKPRKNNLNLIEHSL